VPAPSQQPPTPTGTGEGGTPAGPAAAGVSWARLEAEAPDLAAVVRDSFTRRKHCTMATLRRDGAPRISGTEVSFEGDEVWVGSMPGAVKALDLLRDPRVAVHSATVDPPEGDNAGWPGEAKLAGVAVEVPGDDPAQTSHRFRIALTEVVHTRLTPAGDALLITSWHPGRGAAEHRRH
jgi:hypothetical protein